MSDTSTETTTKIELKTPSMWKVVFRNDDYTPCDFVQFLLMQLFNKDFEEALRLTYHIHEKGSAVVGIFTRDVAETKARHVILAAQGNGHPLQAIAEEA